MVRRLKLNWYLIATILVSVATLCVDYILIQKFIDILNKE